MSSLLYPIHFNQIELMKFNKKSYEPNSSKKIIDLN